MKKIILVLFVLGLFANSAMAGMKESIYVGGGLSYMAVPDYGDAGIGLSIKAGIDLDGVLENFGAQIEIQKSIMDPEYGNIDVNILTLAGYATYNIVIPSTKICVRPRFGFILPNLGDDESVNSRNYGFSSGLDVTYKIASNLKVYGGFTNLGEAVNTYIIGAEFHF